MKKRAFYLLIPMGVIFMGFSFSVKTADVYLAGCKHMINSTVRIQGEKVVYFDPYEVREESHDGDLVFVSHPHGDHFQISSIRKVIKAGGTIVITPTGVEPLQEAGFTQIQAVEPHQDYQVAGVSFKTVPAYNPDKFYHYKASNYVGYIVELNSYKYYFAGDTGLIPEMNVIKADVAFLPVDGRFTMNAEEAAEAAKIIKPAVAVPIHFDAVAGSRLDAERFISLLPPEFKGVILQDK